MCRYLGRGSEYYGHGDEERLEEVIRGFSPPNANSKKLNKQNRKKAHAEEVFIFYFNYTERENEPGLWSLFGDLLSYMKDTKQCRCAMVTRSLK